MTTLSIQLPKKEKERLSKLALSYGLSLQDTSRHIISEITKSLLSIPEESLEEYENSDEIRKAFTSALEAQHKGKLRRTLPRSLRARR